LTISQDPVKPGGRFVYEFNIHQEGTYFYHSHMAMQEMAGMLGAFIMHPKQPYQPHCDKDFLIHLQEYAVLPNNTVPNTMNMEFNWLVFNGKAGPATTPLIVRLGDRVRIRFVNLGMDHHPMHLHGHTFYTTGTEGGRIPEAGWWPGNTVLVGVAQARNVEFVANNPGDWMIHCHLPHHMMNQMSSNAGKMTRTAGMPAGGDMNTGMGMLKGTPDAPIHTDWWTSYPDVQRFLDHYHQLAERWRGAGIDQMKRILLVLFACILVVAVSCVLYATKMVHRGFSTRAAPGSVEASLAMLMRDMAIPSHYKTMKNPVATTPEVINDGMAHWADHCATCHADNGSGDTMYGKTMYPPPPDMRQKDTQEMSDGELYYTIKNGVRLSGMPAFGDPADDDTDSSATTTHHH
jgi:mono/diheme cytochrome c family protein